MALISPINRIRMLRLWRTFREVYAETESLPRSIAHITRFSAKKIGPLARYLTSTLVRLSMIKRLHRVNAALMADHPVLGIRILGGIGDYIVIARFLRDLSIATEPLIFDVYSNKPSLVLWIFAALPGFRSSFDEALFAPAESVYTVCAQISQFVLIEDAWVSVPKLRIFPRLQRVVARVQHFRPSIAPIVAEHPRLDSFLAQKAIFANRSRRDYLHYTAGLLYNGDHLSLYVADGIGVARGLREGRYITVHNGYDPNMVVSSNRATKCYPHFGRVIALLRETHPECAFIQVGIQTSDPIEEVDVNLIGKTSLPEVASLIQGAILHLDNEGGLVHVARALGTVSCVVFGPTSSRYFGYEGNIAIDPRFCGGCWWINETWMNHCPRGFAYARCMTEQPPSVIADEVARFLERIPQSEKVNP